MPSILLVGAVMLCGAAMALLYAGERPAQRYQKLVDDNGMQNGSSSQRQQQHELAWLQDRQQ